MNETTGNIQVLTIPKWGLSMEEGTIVEWLINEGDDFVEGQEVCEIETSKIANALEAPFSGTLRKILAHPGETLPVQAPIAVSAPQEVPDEEIEAFVATLDIPAATEQAASQTRIDSGESRQASSGERNRTKSQSGSPRTLPAAGQIAIPAPLKTGEDDSAVHATPRARALASKHGVNLNQVDGSGRNGRISIADIRRSVSDAGGEFPAATPHVTENAGAPQNIGNDSRIPATPAARRVAVSLGVNLEDCKATGRNGRISRQDVENAHRLTHGPAVEEGAPDLPGIDPLPDSNHKFDDAPLTGMRKVIATRMAQSKRTAPHFRLTIDCRMNSLLALRKQINSENPAARVSINDFVVKAAAMALMEVPGCNIQFNGETIRTFEDAHISVAVALEAGLITPIVSSANRKGLMEISNEIRSLATRARAGALKAEEIRGGAFTVSNLGMFGIRHFDAIINPPQAAVLAVGAGTPRVVVSDGKQETGTVVTNTLCCDHRVIDGALGARWLAAFREFIEKPARLLS